MSKKTPSLDIIRHSTAHLMAAAVLEFFPSAKFGIGPTIENGFYYDFDLPRTLTPEDLVKIEKIMKQLVKKNLPFEKEIFEIDKAIRLFKKLNQPYKVELLEDIKKRGTTKVSDKKPATTETQKKTETQKNFSVSEKFSASVVARKIFVTIYKLGKFIDLCKGPHVKSTKELGVFKLTRLAGAYWRGNEKNKMLQRIYGVAFKSKADLHKFLKLQEEAEKRDHRKIGRDLDLFSIDEEVGPGLVLWHPKGAMLRQIIEDFWRKEHWANGYELVQTPHIGKLNLWKTSGHWDFYRENMYPPIKIEEERYLIKPMNCPFHLKIYQKDIRSWRDLPIRWAELATVYRFEKSGVLHGLTRVRGFTQDDAHTFCRPENLNKEIEKTVRFGIKMLRSFRFKNYEICLATRPKKYVGSLKIWQKATGALKRALERLKLSYQIDPEGGVFYGPKIDIKIKDSLGRAWQCTTIQVDFNMPERFEMSYINKKGKKARPIMIHRALLGSLERFVGMLLEHYAGALPVWLSPIQVYITPVGKRHRKAAQKLGKELKMVYNIRCRVDVLNETISYKIRKAEKQKIPYILVIGDKEMKGLTLNVRQRGETKVFRMTKKKFIDKIIKEIERRK